MKLRIKNNKLTFFKKITGTNIADLAGLNKFKPRGDALLAMLDIVKEPFDKFYTDRGAIAEKLAYQSLTKRGFKCVVYDAKKLDYDNFPENPYFGGLIDIEIPSLSTLYEIKSKNIKDYDKIVKFGDIVQEEQAKHYGYMRRYNTVHIMWIFFDDATEECIRNGQPITTYKNLKMFEKPLPIDFEYEKKIHTEAVLYYINCLARQEVPLEDISDKYLELLKLKRPDSNKTNSVSNPVQNGNSIPNLQINLFGEEVPFK